MFKGVLRVDQDVIDVGSAEVINVVKQNWIDEALEGGRSIAEAEGHNSVVVGAVARAEGSEIFNVFLKPDAIEGVMNVKLYEDVSFR